jgi:hypothetical protein
MLHAWEVWQIRTNIWSEDLKMKDHLEDQGLDGRMLLK